MTTPVQQSAVPLLTLGRPGPWRVSDRSAAFGCVVSDEPAHRPGYTPEDEASDVAFYGGHLVAESIMQRNLGLVASAPLGYDLARCVVAYFTEAFGGVPDELFDTDLALLRLSQAIVALVEHGTPPAADVSTIAIVKSGAK